MKPLGYVVGAIAIVGSLSLVALTLRPGSATSQPKIVKAELAPKPAAPVVEDQTLRTINPPRPATLPDALSRPEAHALASALVPDESDRPVLETIGRSLATDRAESRARMPAKMKRGKGGALKARKALRVKSAQKKR